MHKVAPSGTFHFISKLDRLCDIVFCPGQGLVVDEACFGLKDADGLKGLLYPKNGADVACRNKDSFIPVGVPRVFSTKWSWDELWPQAATKRVHAGAISRRIIWVDITRDIRRPDSSSVASGFDYFMQGRSSKKKRNHVFAIYTHEGPASHSCKTTCFFRQG